jgi:hypothetical protein
MKLPTKQHGRTTPSLRLLCAGLATAFTLAACGGGGGDTGTLAGGTTPPPASTIPPAGSGEPDVRTLGDAFSTYWNLCAKPRSGIDPYTGKPYPDRQGTLRDELTFLRAWSHQYYLWYNEIPADFKMADFTDPIAYFDKLKTPVLTAAGAKKDKYHFTYPTAEWNAMQVGIERGYGFTWSSAGPTAPRSWQIAIVEPGSPAAAAGLRRGDLLVRVDDIDFVNASDKALVDRINAALFPENAGETHSFVVRRAGIDLAPVTMASQDVQATSVKNVKTFDTATGKTGYLSFENHNAVSERQLIDAFTTLRNQGVNALVLDMRYNGGGLLNIAAQLGYMIAGPTSSGKVFERLRYNDKIEARQQPQIINFSDRAYGFEAGAGTVAKNSVLPTLGLNRVTILTTLGTCSASESLINGLRGIDIQVDVIGAQTCGKPYGFTPVPNCGTTYFSIEFGGVNAKGIGDFADGFAPTCAVADDLARDLGDPNEALLATALSYQQTGTCPALGRSSAAAMSVAAPRTMVRPAVSQIAIHTRAR